MNPFDQSDPTKNGGFLKFWFSRGAFFRDAPEPLNLGPLRRFEQIEDSAVTEAVRTAHPEALV